MLSESVSVVCNFVNGLVLATVLASVTSAMLNAEPGTRGRAAMMGAALGGALALSWPLILYERRFPEETRLTVIFSEVPVVNRSCYTVHSRNDWPTAPPTIAPV